MTGEVKQWRSLLGDVYGVDSKSKTKVKYVKYKDAMPARMWDISTSDAGIGMGSSTFGCQAADRVFIIYGSTLYDRYVTSRVMCHVLDVMTC